MEREEQVKQLSSWIHANKNDFYAFKEDEMTLKCLCNILAKEFLNFKLAKKEK